MRHRPPVGGRSRPPAPSLTSGRLLIKRDQESKHSPRHRRRHRPLLWRRHRLRGKTMARKLIYSLQMSLDGYIEDSSGSIGFTHPEPDPHAYINDLEAGIDTHIYGRRLYETMHGFWPTAGDDPDAPPEIVDYARIWNALDKLVFSRTLESVGARTRLAADDIPTELARLRA